MPTLEKIVQNIKSVKVQGAKEIAIYALKFLKKFCKKNGFKLKFEVASMVLEEARPTAVVLHNCLEILKKKRNLRTIDGLLNRLDQNTAKLAKKGSRLIKKNYKIMTHCHSGEALAVIKQTNKEGRKISVIATVTQPLEQGIKTAKELKKEKIDVTLITDSAVGYFMKEVDMVLVGADAIRLKPPHGVVNKIGTYLIATVAKDKRKPFYVAANSLKFDKREKLKIEERSPSEIIRNLLTISNLKGIKVRNPAFDIVPKKFVTGIITEKNILKPKRIWKK